MPELPDIVVYLEALEQRVLGHVLERVRIAGPFLLRTAVPPIDSVQAARSLSCGVWERIRRIREWNVAGVHLMIAAIALEDQGGRSGWTADAARLSLIRVR